MILQFYIADNYVSWFNLVYCEMARFRSFSHHQADHISSWSKPEHHILTYKFLFWRWNLVWNVQDERKFNYWSNILLIINDKIK